jgi:hypothetical protein
MPFKSQKQRAWMYANRPEMAKEWESATSDKKLPKRVKKHTRKKSHRGGKGGR